MDLSVVITVAAGVAVGGVLTLVRPLIETVRRRGARSVMVTLPDGTDREIELTALTEAKIQEVVRTLLEAQDGTQENP